MTKLNNFNQYVLKKCLIGDGMINGIINAIIFYFLAMLANFVINYI